MKRFALLLTLTAAATVIVARTDLFASTSAAQTEGEVIDISEIGVSIAGAEFGSEKRGFSNENPGRMSVDYTYNSEETVEYFASEGLRLQRLPIRWERLQPRLGGELDPVELGHVRRFVSWASRNNAAVILDIHNYGRYTLKMNGRPRTLVIDQRVGNKVPVSRDHFADLWVRLSKEFAGERAVAAYGLMNEPHDMGRSDWKAISQHAVNAIRKLEDSKMILVAGDGWSNAHRFAEVNGPTAWIQDPFNNFAYEAHCYFDADHTGTYTKSFDAELRADAELAQRPIKRLMPFVEWCLTNKVRGFIGEFGVPKGDERWNDLLGSFVETMRRVNMGGCYWAGGEWWGDYSLSIQPSGRGEVRAPQMEQLLLSK